MKYLNDALIDYNILLNIKWLGLGIIGSMLIINSLDFILNYRKKNKKEIPIFDTHCHLTEYEDLKIEEIINKAKEVGVKYILNIGYDLETNKKVIKQSQEFTGLLIALGLHPDCDYALNEENLIWIERHLNNKKVIALGEIGLEYYDSKTDIKKQKYWFARQLTLAKFYNMPVLLHIRDESQQAYKDAYKIIKEIGVERGILHAYTGDWEMAKKFLALGFYISFAGNIIDEVGKGKWEERWKEVIEKIPLERLLIETDAPYISPYPHHIIYTIKKIAEIKNISIEEINKITYLNALNLFHSRLY